MREGPRAALDLPAEPRARVGLDRPALAVGLVVDAAAPVAADRHRAVAAVVARAPGHGLGRVDRQMAGVDPEPIAMRVAVAEEPGLQHAIGRGSDAGHEGARIEARVLGLGEVVVGRSVERQLADLDQRVVGVGPDLGQIEGVEAIGLGVRVRHDLDLQRPRGALAALDRLVHVDVVVARVLAAELGRLRVGQAADALIGLEVELDPRALAGRVDPLEGVRAEAVHVAQAGRDPAITEEPHELVGGLGRVGEEAPDVVGLLPVGVGIGLLRVDEVGELDAVADEEDRRVVADQIPVRVFGVELDREAPRITNAVGRAARAGHRREAGEHLRRLAELREHLHRRPLG